jgi:hypothetical protein
VLLFHLLQRLNAFDLTVSQTTVGKDLRVFKRWLFCHWTNVEIIIVLFMKTTKRCFVRELVLGKLLKCDTDI